MSRGQENIKQKQHCNKFSKDFKNGPHPKKKLKKKKELFPAFLLHLNPCVLPATPHCVLISFTKMLPLSGASSTSLLWSLLFFKAQLSTPFFLRSSLTTEVLVLEESLAPSLSKLLPVYQAVSLGYALSPSHCIQNWHYFLPKTCSFLVHILWGVSTTPQS